jgi:hypothetical protein
VFPLNNVSAKWFKFIAEVLNYIRRVGKLEFIITFHIWILVIKKVKGKAVPLHAMEALGGRGDIALTHSRPRH